MTRLLICLLMLALTCSGAAAADDPPVAEGQNAEEVQSVAVSGIRNPELRSYRSMLAGLEAFEANRRMAPQADVLRFKLKPKHAAETVNGLSLRIAGGDTSIQVPIAADGSFVLPRDKGADDNDADLILNRPKGAWNGKPFVRSANLPANMLRLGDIRLECQVAMAVVKTQINFVLRAAANVILAGTDWCQSKRINYGGDAPFLSDSITLVAGERRVVMQAGRQQRSFTLPIQDSSWPDDTLVEFQPSAPATLAEYTSEPLYLRGSMNKWSATLPLKQVDATNFRVDTALPKGVSRFRIGTKDFRVANLGAGDSKLNETKGNFKVGEGKVLVAAGVDVWFEPPQAGMYTFALNLADPQAPVLTITAH
jgi:hypothetical protein